jgi:hypothetical protein
MFNFQINSFGLDLLGEILALRVFITSLLSETVSNSL